MALEPGSSLLVNDGKIRLRVDRLRRGLSPIARSRWAARSPIARGSTCRDVVLPLPRPCRKKDRADLEFVCLAGGRLVGAVVRAACRGRDRGAKAHVGSRGDSCRR